MFNEPIEQSTDWQADTDELLDAAEQQRLAAVELERRATGYRFLGSVAAGLGVALVGAGSQILANSEAVPDKVKPILRIAGVALTGIGAGIEIAATVLYSRHS